MVLPQESKILIVVFIQLALKWTCSVAVQVDPKSEVYQNHNIHDQNPIERQSHGYEVQTYPNQDQSINSGYGWPQHHQAEPEPLAYTYVVIPDKKEKHHGHGHNHHHESHHKPSHNKGWGWGWPMEQHKGTKTKEKDGTEFFKSLLGIKILKLLIPVVIVKLFLLVFILAGISKAGTVLSPLTLPFISLPIAIAALVFFIPLFIAALILLVIIDTLHSDDDDDEEGGHGWGWSRRKGKRSRRHITKDDFIQNRVMSILGKLPDLQSDHFDW